jgi:hypothetical protein
MLLSWKAAIQKTGGPGAAIVIYTVRVNEIKKFVVWKPTREDGATTALAWICFDCRKKAVSRRFYLCWD